MTDVNFILSAYKSTLQDFKQRIPGFQDKKQQLLPNGYDEEDYNDLKTLDIPLEADLNIGFSGSFYSHLNTPQALFGAIRLLKKENITVCFHHIGSSVQDLEAMAIKYDISENIMIWGYKKHKECLAVLNIMDVLCIILDGKWPHSQNTIGGKFYEYLRLKKPILAIVPPDGEASKAIRETDSGLVVAENKVTLIAEAIKQLLHSQIPLSWKGIEKFNRAEQAKVLDKFLRGLI